MSCATARPSSQQEPAARAEQHAPLLCRRCQFHKILLGLTSFDRMLPAWLMFGINCPGTFRRGSSTLVRTWLVAFSWHHATQTTRRLVLYVVLWGQQDAHLTFLQAVRPSSASFFPPHGHFRQVLRCVPCKHVSATEFDGISSCNLTTLRATSLGTILPDQVICDVHTPWSLFSGYWQSILV